ncbi:MFS transporter [Falsiroseomonas bella]|uniref:MFS transporter n=1 Tax=Falsiroseomonas bella TaxID=2184016 RepID=A0A317FI92_9PROT|nr:MFS transporter [Falsiroseomonas bella]PWS38445.1 MFS transporter [Falsiroseomonas bella]
MRAFPPPSIASPCGPGEHSDAVCEVRRAPGGSAGDGGKPDAEHAARAPRGSPSRRGGAVPRGLSHAPAASDPQVSAAHTLAAIVAAQVFVQVGAFFLPALLPAFIARWSLSATEAGWLVGAFFAAYVPTVPVLVALTDRVPARRVYLAGAGLTALSHLGMAVAADGFWGALLLRAVAGVGWAACYMPGLKMIADRLEGAAQSRAVSWHALGVGIAGAASFAVAGLLDAIAGPALVFMFGAVTAAAAFGTVALVIRPGGARSGPKVPVAELLDFRPVFRNRPAMAWIAGYSVHTWEMAALRAWGVTFLALIMTRSDAPDWLPGPNTLFSAAGLLGIAISVSGNELAQRFGRARIVAGAMLAGAVLSVATGLSFGLWPPIAICCVLAWNAAIYLDSAALTAGTVAAADKARRGATMGLHSMCGYAGGFIGPLGVGLALDVAGRDTVMGWAVAFGHLAPVVLVGLLVLRRLR